MEKFPNLFQLNAYRKQSPNHTELTTLLTRNNKIGLLRRCLTCSLEWMAADSYFFYLFHLRRIEQITAAVPEWKHEILQIINSLNISYAKYFEDNGNPYREELDLIDLRQEIEQELLGLNPIPMSLLEESETGASQLIMEIKDAVQKGNRTSFKLIQELQQKLDELSEGSSADQRRKVQDEVESADRRVKELTALLLETFDLLDLVRESVKAKGDADWTRELELVVVKALQMLADYGLEEIQVQDHMFDGEIMEGIGTVPGNEIPTGYQKYQVYTVIRRGFRRKDSGELVRKARVTTVY